MYRWLLLCKWNHSARRFVTWIAESNKYKPIIMFFYNDNKLSADFIDTLSCCWFQWVENVLSDVLLFVETIQNQNLSNLIFRKKEQPFQFHKLFYCPGRIIISKTDTKNQNWQRSIDYKSCTESNIWTKIRSSFTRFLWFFRFFITKFFQLKTL